MKKFLLVACLFVTGLPGRAQLKPGKPVPEISLPDTKDSVRNLSSLKGKVVLVDFWAS